MALKVHPGLGQGFLVSYDRYFFKDGVQLVLKRILPVCLFLKYRADMKRFLPRSRDQPPQTRAVLGQFTAKPRLNSQSFRPEPALFSVGVFCRSLLNCKPLLCMSVSWLAPWDMFPADNSFRRRDKYSPSLTRHLFGILPGPPGSITDRAMECFWGRGRESYL